MQKLRHLDLFSGIGGFALGLSWTGGFETVGFVEIEPFCQKVLGKHWPEVPIHSDITTFKGDEFGTVDIITGGLPCQPFSRSGKRRGKKDDRFLWPQMFRVIEKSRPAWGVGENVADFDGVELDEALSNLEGIGYQAQQVELPACSVDAPHQRRRCWILAHAQGERRGSIYKEQRVFQEENKKIPRPPRYSWTPSRREDSKRFLWPPESGLVRVADGVPGRVDRIKAIGNAVVPQIPYIIGKAILEVEPTL